MYYSSECFDLMICKNARSCPHGNYMTLLLISSVYKTLACGFADNKFEAFRAVKLIQQLADNLNFKGLVFYTSSIISINVCTYTEHRKFHYLPCPDILHPHTKWSLKIGAKFECVTPNLNDVVK